MKSIQFIGVLSPLALLIAAGCVAPIGADRTSGVAVYKQVTANARERQLSDDSQVVLHRYALEDEFKHAPQATLLHLQELTCVDDRRDLLFTLGELNFLEAERRMHSGKPGVWRTAADAYLASAIFSWTYLFGERPEPPPSPYDRRFRVACDLYNYAVAHAFIAGARTNLNLQLSNDTRQFGPTRVQVELSQPSFKWSLDELQSLVPADDFQVRGLARAQPPLRPRFSPHCSRQITGHERPRPASSCHASASRPF